MKHSYATSPEILGYFKDVVEKHNLARFAKLGHTVRGAVWNEATSKWTLKIEPNGRPDAAFEDEGDILFNATGVLKSEFLHRSIADKGDC